jgi:hypothetical protein
MIAANTLITPGEHLGMPNTQNANTPIAIGNKLLEAAMGGPCVLDEQSVSGRYRAAVTRPFNPGDVGWNSAMDESGTPLLSYDKPNLNNPISVPTPPELANMPALTTS